MTNLLNVLQRLNKSQDNLLPIKLYVAVQNAYTEPHRFYHSIGHLLSLWHLFEDFLKASPSSFAPEEQDLIRLAFAEHDIVYVPGFEQSVEGSVQLAEIHAKMLGLSSVTRLFLRSLIESTAHTSESDKATDVFSLQLIRDLDLAILGAPWPTFRQYDVDIDSEYSITFGGAAFKEGRRKFLEGYLKKDRIFVTDYCHQTFEKSAKENIQRALDQIY